MRAVRIHRYGGPEELRLDEVPRPTPRPRDLIVRVHAASVNPVDAKLRGGGQRALMHYRLPWILGLDFSGEVVEVGEAVEGYRPGDAVFGYPTHRRPGSYADFIAVDEREVAPKPSSLTHIEAAGIPLVSLTAHTALVRKGRLEAGGKVLIHAGAGGVGSMAIQLAKALGATVATTCSARNLELVRSLGADHAIDYETEAFDERLSDYDLVVDTIGSETRERSFRVLRRGGRLCTLIGGFPELTEKYGVALGAIVASAELVSLSIRGPLVHGVWVHHVIGWPNGEVLREVGELVEAGTIEPLIDSVLPLEEIVEAHRRIESHRSRGKIILDLM